MKTIVPAAGIASWYDYFNSQGSAYTNPPYSDLSWLSLYVATRLLDQKDWAAISNKYADYINQLNKDQNATAAITVRYGRSGITRYIQKR